MLDFIQCVMNRCRIKGYDDGCRDSLDAGNEYASVQRLFNSPLLQVEEKPLAVSYLITENTEAHKPAHHVGSKTAA